jgi:hypothetical protein
MGGFLSLKSGDRLNDTRIKRESVTVHRGYISMLLMIQDIVAKRLIQNEDAITRGLLSRMYFIDPKFVRNKIRFHEPFTKPLHNLLADTMGHYLDERIRITMDSAQNILDGFPVDYATLFQPTLIDCDPEAVDLFLEFYNEGVDLESALASADKRIPGECSRWREDAVQISGKLCVLECKTRINGEIARRAMNTVRWNKKNYLMQFMKHNFNDMGEKFEKLEGIIEKSRQGQISTRDLKCNHGFVAEDIETLQHLYGDEIEIVTIKPKGRGRPSSVIRFKQK